ncbi:MAG: DinB family protein [Chloroflexota bacterium]|nr:DinB family protein [Chloroflexota bacterium]
MAIEQSVLANNQNTRERLETLVTRLTDEELGRPLGDGRTIATILGHVAFWDQRTLILLRRWLAGKADPSSSDQEPEDVHWLNDAVHAFHLLIPPRQLAHFARSTAREVDGLVEAVPSDLVRAIQAVGNPISLNRGAHRGEHLDEIERFLTAS